MFRKRMGIVAGAVVGAMAIGMTPAAAAAAEPEGPVSTAEGRFLSGSLAGLDLDALAALAPAVASNDGTGPTVRQRHPLDLTVLDAIRLAPGRIALTAAPGVDVGVIGQTAEARAGGAFASSGLLGADGAIAVSPGPGTEVTIDLAKLLGDRLTSALAGLRLQAAGIAAQASAQLGELHGDYTLADARLALVVPAIAQTPDAAASALAPVQAAIARLAGGDGLIAQALSTGLTGIDPALRLLGSGATVQVRIDAALQPVLDAIRSTVLHDAALRVDLGTGEIVADLARLSTGPSLSELAPGQELLSPSVVGGIVHGVERLLEQYLDGLATTIREVLDAAQLHVEAHLAIGKRVRTGTRTVDVPRTVTQLVDRVTGTVLGTVDTVTGAVTSLVPGQSDDALVQRLRGLLDPVLGDGGLLGGRLDGLLGGLLHGGRHGGGAGTPDPATASDGILSRVVTTVEHVVEPVFETLNTGVDLELDGSLADYRAGGVHATAAATVLGIPIELDLRLLLAPIVRTLTDALLGSHGVLASVLDDLDAVVLTPATQVLGGTQGLAPVLGDLVSVQANVQQHSGDEGLRQTALRVSLLGGALAQIDLASAAVTSTRGGGTTPGGGDPGGEDPGTHPIPSGPSSLPVTGAEPLLLALLAAALLGLGALLRLRRRGRVG